MGYLSAKDEGNQFFKHVPHFRDFTRSSGTFSLKYMFQIISLLDLVLLNNRR